MATTTETKTELPGMPARPELRTAKGRIIENAAQALAEQDGE